MLVNGCQKKRGRATDEQRFDGKQGGVEKNQKHFEEYCSKSTGGRNRLGDRGNEEGMGGEKWKKS